MGWAEGRDGLRGAGSAGGVERKARAERCALPGTPTPRRPRVGGGVRGRGALCREERKGDPDSGQSARLELTGGAGERGGGAARRRGGLGLRWDRWEPGWTGPTEREAGGEGCEEADGGRALSGGSRGDLEG